MATYLEVNFENHPAISAEYVKFLATNLSFDKVEQLETTVATLKVQVDKAVADAAKSRSTADGTGSAISTSVKAVAELTKRVTRLESKK